MKHKTKIIVGISLLLLMLTSGCIGQEEPVTEKVVLIGTTASLDTWDSPHGSSWPYYCVSNFIGDSLVIFEPPDVTEVAPWLATDWTVSSDAKTWTFTLREGVKFQDGTPFNASAVKMHFDYVIAEQGPQSSYFVDVNKIVVEDTYRVRFDLNRGNSLFVKILGMGLASAIVSPTARIKTGPDWGRISYVGTGPFTFVEWVKGDRLVMEKNPDWWGIEADLPTWAPEPKVDKIIMKLFTDASAARIALETGDVDMFWKFPNPADIPTLKDNPDIETHTSLAGYLRYLTFTQTYDELKDKRVRQAICYGINVDDVFEVGYQGDGKLVFSNVQSFFTPYYQPVFEKYRHDPEKAKQLLAEAGYPNGFTMDYYYTPTHWDILDKNAAEVIQSNLAEVGITLNLIVQEYAHFVADAVEGRMPLVTLGWLLDYPDPDNTMMQTIHPEWGWIREILHWDPEDPAAARFAELGDLGRIETDMQKRIEIYNEAQEIMAEECPIYPMKESYIYCFTRKWIKDFKLYNNEYVDKLGVMSMDIEKTTPVALAMGWQSPMVLMLAAVLQIQTPQHVRREKE